eukprot:jgi/Mesvir1/5965/Mv00721-RA.1
MASDDGECPPIMAAVEAKNMALFQQCVIAKDDLDATDSNGCTALILAAKTSCWEMANILIEQGANVTLKNKKGDGAIHWAAYHGAYNLVVALVAHGADIEDPGEYGNRPLHLACTTSRERVASYLLQHGASVKARNVYGNTPLALATDASVRSMVKEVEASDAAREALKLRDLELADRESAQAGESLKKQEEEAAKQAEIQRKIEEKKLREKMEADAADAEEHERVVATEARLTFGKVTPTQESVLRSIEWS